MSKSFLTITFLLSCIIVFSQKRAFELSLLGRYDRHANYVTNFDRAQDDTMQLFGASFGIGLQFNEPVGRNLNLYAGIGFYRHRVDKSTPHNIHSVAWATIVLSTTLMVVRIFSMGQIITFTTTLAIRLGQNGNLR